MIIDVQKVSFKGFFFLLNTLVGLSRSYRLKTPKIEKKKAYNMFFLQKYIDL